VFQGPDELLRIVLEHPFADGTVAIDLDPLSLLSRLAMRGAEGGALMGTPPDSSQVRHA